METGIPKGDQEEASYNGPGERRQRLNPEGWLWRRGDW